jgi:phosphatidate cytidylyltransferase
VKRVITAAFLVPLVIILLFKAPPFFLYLLITVMILQSQLEFYKILESKNLGYYPGLGFVFSGLIPLFFYWNKKELIPFPLYLFIIVLLGRQLSRRDNIVSERVHPLGNTLLGVLYTSWLFSHFIPLYLLPQGKGYIFFVLLVIWLGDTAAYYVGSNWGRHKLAYHISPNKTIEGAIANVAGGVLGAFLARVWVLDSWGLMSTLIIGILLNIIGQLGDLSESFLKRSVGVKDSGRFFPGHGGVLDRLDSLLFAGPAMYYYCLFIRI